MYMTPQYGGGYRSLSLQDCMIGFVPCGGGGGALLE